jgi:hypothetical protein
MAKKLRVQNKITKKRKSLLKDTGKTIPSMVSAETKEW